MFEVVDHTKTHTDRIVPLVKTAIALLNELRFKSGVVSDDSYIFVRDGARITSRQITYALEKACVQTIEDGKMTKDLALITSIENPTVLNSEGFIKAIRETLEGLL